MALFVGFVIGVGWFLSYFYSSPQLLWIAVIFSTVMSITSYWFSDKIALSIAGAKPVLHDEDPELYHVVENLAITAGLPIPRIYITPEMAPNAFATGRDPEHAVIAVTAGLRQKLDRTELEAVIAHELSHIGNRDMLLGTVVSVLVGFISIVADIFIRSRFLGGGRDDDRGGNGLIALLGIVFMILAPLAATMIQLAVSRKREFLADASGALLTRYPAGLISALQKISADPEPMEHASNATAHLWFESPFKGKKNAFSNLFLTHPPVEARITALRNMGM